MVIDPTSPRTRRALLTGIGGALAALAAQALGRPLTTLAEGEAITVGGEFPTATSRTFLKNSVNNDDVLVVVTTGTGKGIWGKNDGGGTGVYGQAQNAGYGVRGVTDIGIGVSGTSSSNPGVWGESSSAAGVRGISSTGPGVRGDSTDDAGVVGNGDTGVSGLGVDTGVSGGSETGTGVNGTSGSGFGVVAQSFSGYALGVGGRALFSTSGIATLKAGTTSRTIDPEVSVGAGSFVLLTPGVDIGARRLWYTTNAGSDRITIHLSSSRTSPTPVAWLLLDTIS